MKRTALLCLLVLSGCFPRVTAPAQAHLRAADTSSSGDLFSGSLLHGRWFVVEGKFGGRSARFLLDTGAEQTVISRELARRLIIASMKTSHRS